MVRAWECSQSKYVLPYPLPTALLHTPATQAHMLTPRKVPSIAWSPSGKETPIVFIEW